MGRRKLEPWREEKSRGRKSGKRKVPCKFCGVKMSAETARRHSGGYVCDECWDIRLEITA